MKRGIIIKNIITLFCIVAICSSCNRSKDNYNYVPTLVPEDPILKTNCEYIIVIGDTQVYTNTESLYSYFSDTMNWIWSQCKYGKNIKCILQTGDITENNLPSQYEVFRNITQPTAELVPYIACPGNHDYDWTSDFKIVDRNSSLFSSFTAFELTRANILSCFEGGKMENIVVNNIIDGENYNIISLEFGPRKEVVKWINSYLKNHPKDKHILLTHEYLGFESERVINNSHAERYFDTTTSTYSTPEELWQNLIKNNDNIVCVICGHNSFIGLLWSNNITGRAVAQSMFNLQFQPNGGDGWIQLWEFPNNENTAKVITYNTITHQEYYDGYFEFKYKF